LVADGCADIKVCGGTDATALECQDHYRVVQAHHDHCAHDTLSEEIEKAFHTYEDACSAGGCAIIRQYDASLPQCPTVDCSKQAGMTAAVTAIEECASDCTSTACTDAFKTIVAFHDTCDEDDLIAEIEHELHEFEDVCEANCNVGTAEQWESAGYNPNACDEDHKDEITTKMTTKKTGVDVSSANTVGVAQWILPSLLVASLVGAV
jgi:hypothetical protein